MAAPVSGSPPKRVAVMAGNARAMQGA
jgi:hypothetical protein